MISHKSAKISMSEEVRKQPEIRSAVEQVNERLPEILGESAGLVEAAWTTSTDSRNRKLVQLKLSDFSGSESASFAPEELEAGGHLDRRLYSLWGDLLKRRSDIAIRELRAAVHLLEVDSETELP